MNIEFFLTTLNALPETIRFEDTMSVVNSSYDFTPTSFKNGDLVNQAGQNSGSCKLFAFALLHGLPEDKTLACFGAYYREDVLKHPDGVDHPNIRNFMKTGWAGIHFDRPPLLAKK
ncbi:HopJ type III effector protein [soil metagenome]